MFIPGHESGARAVTFIEVVSAGTQQSRPCCQHGRTVREATPANAAETMRYVAEAENGNVGSKKRAVIE